MTARTTSNGHKLVSLDELVAMDLPFEDVDVPEFGEGTQIRLNAVTGAKRAQLAGKNSDVQGAEQRLEFVHELVATSIGGNATAESVGKLPSTVVDRLSAVALRLAGMGTAVDDAEEQLKGTPSGDSG